MTWDSSRPSGGKFLNLSDDDLRENAVAIEAALGLEHQFATGAVQTGAHSFPVGTDAERLTAFPTPVVGNVWFNTSDYATRAWLIRQVYYDGDWRNIGFVDLNVARVDEGRVWSAAQFAIYQNIVPGAGTPMEIDWDLDDGTYFKSTITADTRVNFPAGTLIAVGNGSNVTLEISNDAGGGYIVTFDSNIIPAYGAQANINELANAVTFINMTFRSDGKLVYAMEYTE